MSKISSKQVKHIALLARLGISGKEEEKFQKELSSILEYVEKLSAADTEDVKVTNQITELEDVFREDETREPIGENKKIISAFPKQKDNYAKVKSILSND